MAGGKYAVELDRNRVAVCADVFSTRNRRRDARHGVWAADALIGDSYCQAALLVRTSLDMRTIRDLSNYQELVGTVW